MSKLITKYTFNLDLSDVKKFELQIAECELQLKQANDYLNELESSTEKDLTEISKYKDITEVLTKRLNDLRRDYANDNHCNLVNRLYSESVIFAIEDFITNEKLITGFLKALFGVDILKFDLNTDESKKFALETVSFFLQTRNESRKK